jgi:hypothetical protein
MRTERPILFHSLVTIAAFVVLALIFTPFPNQIPHPEDFSPLVYLAAFAISLVLLIWRQSWRQHWLYLPLPLIALFGYLEEISYGLEGTGAEPFYVDLFQVKAYDVHNLIPAMLRTLRDSLGLHDWSPILFDEFAWIAVAMLALPAAFFVWARRSDPGKAEPNFLRATATLSIPVSAYAAYLLLALPSDNKGAILFGLSIERLALLAVFVLALAGAVYLMLSLRDAARRPALITRVDAWLAADMSRRLTRVSALLAVLAGMALMIWAPAPGFESLIVLLRRLAPLAGWAATLGALALMAVPTWLGRYPHPTAERPRRLQRFLKSQPAFIYMLIGMILIIYAQLLDRGFYDFNALIHWPEFWVRNWNLQIEEFSEMVGAFLFIFSALLFPDERN